MGGWPGRAAWRIAGDAGFSVTCAVALAFWASRIAESWGAGYAAVDGAVSMVAVAFVLVRRRHRAWCAVGGIVVAAAAIAIARLAALPSEPGPVLALALAVLVGSAVAALPARPAVAIALGGAAIAAGSLLTDHVSGLPPVLVLNAVGWLAAIGYGTGVRFLAARRRAAAARIREDERRRLARELHDVVGHHLTRIVLQSQAAQILARDAAVPAEAVPAAHTPPGSAPPASAPGCQEAGGSRPDRPEPDDAASTGPASGRPVFAGAGPDDSGPDGPPSAVSAPGRAGPAAGPAVAGRTPAGNGGSAPTGVAALAGIEAAGSAALGALRQVVGLLREGGDAGLIAVPRLAELAAAFDGPDVRLEVGDGDEETWPVEVRTTVYRIVQEALTNVARHAPHAGSVTVGVTRRGGAVVVDVADDAAPGRDRDRGRDYGLAGMRERVEALGGTLEAGPRAGGGWAVHATLPVRDGR